MRRTQAFALSVLVVLAFLGEEAGRPGVGDGDAIRVAGQPAPGDEPGVEVDARRAFEREQFLNEWAERSADPNSLFFSPIVVGAAGRKP